MLRKKVFAVFLYAIMSKQTIAQRELVKVL